MAGTDASVKACKTLSEDERAAWVLYYAAWKKHYETPVGWWGLGNEWDACETLEASLKEWQERLSSKCPMATPTVKGPDGAPDWSIIKWGAVAVVAVSAVVGIAYVAPMISPFLPSRK